MVFQGFDYCSTNLICLPPSDGMYATTYQELKEIHLLPTEEELVC